MLDDISLIYSDKRLHVKEEERWKSVDQSEAVDPLLAPLSFFLLFLPSIIIIIIIVLFSGEGEGCDYVKEL